jgi:hypothetical protein
MDEVNFDRMTFDEFKEVPYHDFVEVELLRVVALGFAVTTAEKAFVLIKRSPRHKAWNRNDEVIFFTTQDWV